MSGGSRFDRRILLAPALSALISVSAPAITFPPGFSDNLVTAVGAPTALAFTPDGRLLITTQGGTLRVVQGGTLLPAAALTLGSKVCSNSERGLLGVAVDPVTFNKNNAGCPTLSQTRSVERVSRFTLPDTSVIDPASELVLIDNVLNFAGKPQRRGRSARRRTSGAFETLGVPRANNAILGLSGTPAGNVTVASGFAVGTAVLVIGVTGWWR